MSGEIKIQLNLPYCLSLSVKLNYQLNFVYRPTNTFTSPTFMFL